MAIAYIFAARASRPAEFGLLVSAIALAAVLAGLWDFGQTARLTRRLSRHRWAGPDEYAKLVFRLIALTAVLCATGFTISLSGVIETGNGIGRLAIITLVLQAPLTMASYSLQAMCRACDQHRRAALAYLCGRIIAAATVIWAATTGQATLPALTIGLVVGLMLEVLALSALLRPVGILRLRRRHLAVVARRPWVAWRGGVAFGISAAMSSSQQLDLPISLLAGGPTIAAQYGAISRWTQPLVLVSNAATLVATPAAMQANSIRAAFLALKPIAPLVAASSLLPVCVALLAPSLTSMLLGPNYNDSAASLAILAIAALLAAASQPIVLVLHARHAEARVAKALVATTAIRLGGAALLGLLFGAAGVAASVLIQQAVLLCAIIGVAIAVDREENAE